MKTLLVLIAAGALLAPPVALARDWGGGFSPRMQAQGQPMKKGNGQPPRGDREKPRGDQDKRHHGRLTDQERRDLHRDLDRANREIYRR